MTDTSAYCAQLSKLTIAGDDQIPVTEFLENEFILELAFFLKMKLTDYTSITRQLRDFKKKYPTAFWWYGNYVLRHMCSEQCYRNIRLKVA